MRLPAKASRGGGSTYLIDDLVRLGLGLIETPIELLEKSADDQVAAALERLQGSGDDLLQLTSAPHDLLSEQFALLAIVGLLRLSLRVRLAGRVGACRAQFGLVVLAERERGRPAGRQLGRLMSSAEIGCSTYLSGAQQQSALVRGRAYLLLDGLAHVGQHLEHCGPAAALLRLLGQRAELALRLTLQRAQVSLEAGDFRVRLLAGRAQGGGQRQRAQRRPVPIDLAR